MPTSIPVVTTVTVISAFIAALLFILGYIKGFRASVQDFESAAESSKQDVTRGWGYLIPSAVVVAAAVIALLGVNPVFISVVPLLSIASTATIGLLFFIEPHLD